MATTVHKVLVQRSTNTAPVFPDQDAEMTWKSRGRTQPSPEMVAENTAGGEPVGAPVAASDAEGDVLTYTLGTTECGELRSAST